MFDNLNQRISLLFITHHTHIPNLVYKIDRFNSDNKYIRIGETGQYIKHEYSNINTT